MGSEVQVSFLCVHCTVNAKGEQIAAKEYAYTNKGKLNTKRWREAGECPRCEGTGFDPSPLPAQVTICRACGGSSLCPYCGGNYLRSWEELPLDIQESYLKSWQKEGTYPEGYALQSKLYDAR